MKECEKENQVKVEGVCQCDEFSISYTDEKGQAICFKCVDGSFKDGNNCLPCPFFCLKCTSSASCDKCEQGLEFDPSSNACQQTQFISSFTNSQPNSFGGQGGIDTFSSSNDFDSSTTFDNSNDFGSNAFDSSPSNNFGDLDSFYSQQNGCNQNMTLNQFTNQCECDQ